MGCVIQAPTWKRSAGQPLGAGKASLDGPQRVGFPGGDGGGVAFQMRDTNRAAGCSIRSELGVEEGEVGWAGSQASIPTAEVLLGKDS